MTNEQYYDLIVPYADASKVLMTKLEILNHNIYRKNPQKPVHHIESRIKSKQSVEEKLLRKGYTDSVMNAKEFLTDIAGIRVICYFPEEIYDLVTALKCQTDLLIIKEKDYIKNPKPNGYRSFHCIYGVPLYCMDATEYYPVEIQFRTLAMDMWASMEHRVNYKKERADKENIGPELLKYSMALELMESRFEEMRKTVGRKDALKFELKEKKTQTEEVQAEVTEIEVTEMDVTEMDVTEDVTEMEAIELEMSVTEKI